MIPFAGSARSTASAARRRLCAGALLVFMAGAAALGSSAAAGPRPATPPSASKTLTPDEFELGDPKAGVVLIEYASDTCSHCARFAADVFPEFRKRYVDTGEVLYVFREFPTPPVPLASAGFVLARCAGADHYLDVVNALFQAQGPALTGLQFLMAGAKVAGLNEAQVRACISDSAAVEALNRRVKAAEETEKIEATPTFLLNGRRLGEGEKTLPELEAAIDPLVKPRGAPGPGV